LSTEVAGTRVLRTRADLREALAAAPRPIGLVPTMGWLHDGHRALMQRARAENATAVVSIFVNPRQFTDATDFTKYPRDEARDLAICESESVDLVFAPDVGEVYVPGFDTTVAVGAVARPLEGAARPGHFDGVATVVAILFGLVRADRAYFGQKDAQQVMVIRRMALDLAIGTEVIACPTVREPDGLALSSRNAYLDAEQRRRATALSGALQEAHVAWRGGERSAKAIEARMRRFLATHPDLQVEYIAVAEPDALAPVAEVQATTVVALAARVGLTRLIDNIVLGEGVT
jgi:pantoate--beta-alanine ligase